MTPTSPENAIVLYYNEQEQGYYLKFNFTGVGGHYSAEVDQEGKQVRVGVDDTTGSKEFEVPLNVTHYGNEVVIRGFLPYPKLLPIKPATKGKITIKFEEDDEAILDRGDKSGKG